MADVSQQRSCKRMTQLQEGVAIDFMKAHLRSMLTEIDKAGQLLI